MGKLVASLFLLATLVLAGQCRDSAAQAELERFTWLPLLEGGILLALILAGATVIFIYWTKQHRLIQMQRAFVANVTHELKSPVASIQLALETMALRELTTYKWVVEGDYHVRP